MGTAVYFKYRPTENFGGRRVLNLGCGGAQFKRPNVVNVDAFDVCKPDLIWNLNKTPLPFQREEFDLIIANHILEHLPKWWDLFNDCARMLKVGGTIEVHIPGDGTSGQLGYRDHVTTINQFSFYGIGNMNRPGTNAWAQAQKLPEVANLECVNQQHRLKNLKWIRWSPQFLREWCSEHLRNVIEEDSYYFKKVRA